MLTLIAQGALAGNVGYMLIVVVVVAAIVAVFLAVARGNGLNVPAWVVNVMWIILAAVVAIFAIRFLLSLL